MTKLQQLLQEHKEVMTKLEDILPQVELIADHIYAAIMQGGKVFLMGNGGSAADCQHIAAELVGRFQAERMPLPAIALTTDTSILTSISNDYGYAYIFSRQIMALCRKGDVVIGITTSGNSKNVLEGILAAKKLGAYTIGLTGEKANNLGDLVDLCLCVPAKNVARIQEAHIFIGHSICELVEEKIVKEAEVIISTPV